MFYIQHGHGKAQRIWNVDARAAIAGVILSPSDESPETLAGTVADCNSRSLQPLLDPQSYVYGPEPVGIGSHHYEHGLNFESLTWHASPKQVIHCVESVRSANEAVGITETWIAPTVYQHTFDNKWAALALQLARTASEEWGAGRTIISVAVSAPALNSWSAVQDWLDVVTSIDALGFYVVVDRGASPYPPAGWNVEQLTNLLRLTYNLAALNGYSVIWGYADLEGLIGEAVGATGFASGWHHTLRQFKRGKWVPQVRRGGKQPIPRVYLPEMWASVTIESEAEALFSQGYKAGLLSRPSIRMLERRGFSEWSLLDCQLQYLRALARTAEHVSNAATTVDRLELVSASLQSARGRHETAAQMGVALDSRYRARIDNMAIALRDFRAAEGV